jgi:tyrosyl-tRNA synthetase
MDPKERLALVTRGTVEVLVEAELKTLLEKKEHPLVYIGYEPSGPFTVGQLVTVRKVLDLEKAGFDVVVFMADLHAMINDKLGGSMEKIREAGRAMMDTYRALGTGPSVKMSWSSELVEAHSYWLRMIRSGKAMSLARAKRAMSIMGRKEEEAELDAAKLFYPAMQVADIFELGVDMAFGGLDQRRAHVLAREVAQRYGWPVPVAIHTPLISSLKGGGRMNAQDEGVMERKMSKSDPTSAIYVTDSEATIKERLLKAYCPPKEVEGNPVVELAMHVVFPWLGKLVVEREQKHGGNIEFGSPEEFLSTWTAGGLHPMDFKTAVASGLARILEPVRKSSLPAGPE